MSEQIDRIRQTHRADPLIFALCGECDRLATALRRLLVELERKHGFRSDVMLHDYGPRNGDAVEPGKHRADCSWCEAEAVLAPPDKT